MLAAWKESGVEPPPQFRDISIVNAPELSFLEHLYFGLYREAATCRPYSANGIPLPIPFTAIDAVCRRWGYEGVSFHNAIHVLRAMDQEELKAANKELSGHAHNRR